MIYSHNTVAAAIQIPDASNHQFVNSSLKNAHVKLNFAMRFMANFKQTCPPERNKHCIIDNKIILHMLIKVQMYDFYFQSGCKTGCFLPFFVLFHPNQGINAPVCVADAGK